MPSQTMTILCQHQDPKSVITSVIERIIDAERCYPIDQAVRDHFNRATESWGRNWGENRGDIEEIDVQTEFLDPGFRVHYTYEESARGCYMGTSRYTIFVPDLLVQLYEKSTTDDYVEADEQLNNEIERLTKERISSIKTEIVEAARAKAAEDAANARAYEDNERAEYDRLREKYGTAS